jgi:hypothetical protein
MDAIESLTVYQADSGEWSTSALRDAVSYVRKSGLQSPGYFHKGDVDPRQDGAGFPPGRLGRSQSAPAASPCTRLPNFAR